MAENNSKEYVKHFNETIEKWIHWLDDYTIKTLCRKPEAGSWSLGQLYVHLIDDTNYFVDQMKICVSSDANREGEMIDYARTMFANNEFPDVKLRGPSTDSSVNQPRSKEELMQGLTLIRNEVNRLNAEFDFSTSVGKTDHPGFKSFSALEWLRFAEMHMRHHMRQKKRIDDVLNRGDATPNEGF